MKMMKKSLIAILIVSAMIVTLIPFTASAAWDGGVATGYSGGTGTEADPYLIGSATELALLAKEVNEEANYHVGEYFKLTADIDLGGINWDPIGNYLTKTEVFMGIFDGDGHTISGLHVDASGTHGGLFGRISEATVMNLNLEGDYVSAGQYTGPISGYGVNSSKIINCTTKIDRVAGFVSGGIVGRMQGVGTSGEPNQIIACFSRSNVSTANGSSVFAGGIIGAMGAGVVSYCGNFGKVSALGVATTLTCAGGIMGIQGADNASSHIYNCFNLGDVEVICTDVKAYAGGIAGRAAHINDLIDFSNIANCFTTGKVSAKNADGTSADGFFGSLCGHIRYIAMIDNCYTTIPLSECEEAGQDDQFSVETGDVTILTDAQMKGDDAVATMKLGEVWVANANDYPSIDVEKALAADPTPDTDTSSAEETTTTTPVDTSSPAEETTTTAPAETTTEAPAETTAQASAETTTQTPADPSDKTKGGPNIFVILIIVVAVVAAGLIVVVVISEKKKAK